MIVINCWDFSTLGLPMVLASYPMALFYGVTRAAGMHGILTNSPTLLIMAAVAVYAMLCVFLPFVVWGLPWIKRRYTVRREAGVTLTFTVRGDADGIDNKFLWLPDSSGFLMYHHRDITYRLYLFQLPPDHEVPEWNRRRFRNEPPAGIDLDDYNADLSFLGAVWDAYGLNLENPAAPTPKHAPLSSQFKAAAEMYDIIHRHTLSHRGFRRLSDAEKLMKAGDLEAAREHCEAVLSSDIWDQTIRDRLRTQAASFLKECEKK